MKEYYDFSKGVKNPYAKKLKEEGYAVTVDYSGKQNENNRGTETEHTPLPDEIAAFEEYRAIMRGPAK
jgi:hypothetical protein